MAHLSARPEACPGNRHQLLMVDAVLMRRRAEEGKQDSKEKKENGNSRAICQCSYLFGQGFRETRNRCQARPGKCVIQLPSRDSVRLPPRASRPHRPCLTVIVAWKAGVHCSNLQSPDTIKRNYLAFLSVNPLFGGARIQRH
ncbi:hypothetical protein VTI74DRAFT_4188 [Chaetomium olivicolor]